MLLATLAAVAVWLAADRLAPEAILARHWRAKLVGLPEPQAIAYLRQIAQFDHGGTEVLVDLLVDGRPELSTVAGQLLHQQLDRWQLLSPEESSARVAIMARLLARRADHMAPAALATAADLARRILQWPVVDSTTDSVQVITDCERVAQRWVNASLSVAGGQVAATPQSKPPTQPTAAANDAVPHGVDLPQPIEPPALPGGGLPVEAVELPPLPPSLAASPQVPLAPANEPRLAPPPMHELPRELFPESDQREPNILPGTVVPESRAPQNVDIADPTASITSPRANNSAHRPPPVDAQSANALSDFELVRRLDGSGSQTEYAATIELARRGFNRVELELGQKLNRADADTRLRLVQVLDRLPVPQTRWLIWLSDDSDVRVRRAAAARMATAQDPALHRRLAEMQQTESDPHLRAQLQQWDQAGNNMLRR